MANDGNDLLSLFERPTEPVFMPKGKNKIVYDVPSEYIVSLICLKYCMLNFFIEVSVLIRIKLRI